MDLRARDLRAVLDAAVALAEVTERDALSEVALVEVRRLIACDHASYNEIDLVTARARVVSDPPELLEAHGLGDFPRLAGQNPLIAYHRRTGDGSPVMLSDFLSQHELHALELHAEVYRDLDINHQLACSLNLRPAVVGVVVNRAHHDFSERDREVMRFLQPHLSAGYRRLRARVSETDALAALTAREREVAGLAAQGMTNAEIAVALLISRKTVNAHLERIFRKLGIRRRAQLAAIVAADPRGDG